MIAVASQEEEEEDGDFHRSLHLVIQEDDRMFVPISE